MLGAHILAIDPRDINAVSPTSIYSGQRVIKLDVVGAQPIRIAIGSIPISLWKPSNSRGPVWTTRIETNR